VASALFVNVLTEDNLPYYFASIDGLFGRDGAWGYWTRRWTAEEGRHSIVLRDYLIMSGRIDPVLLERARMAQVTGGVSPQPTSIADAFAYLALQELATRIAHHNTGKALPDTEGYTVMKRVAADENLHYLFYRDLVSAALEIDPSGMVEAIKRQVLTFEMPGTGILGFAQHAKAIASAGIYDLNVHHDAILRPVVLGHWDVEGRQSPTGAVHHQVGPGVVEEQGAPQRGARRSITAIEPRHWSLMPWPSPGAGVRAHKPRPHLPVRSAKMQDVEEEGRGGR
jgi:acyl-[acyl-carrier-protein] desaturase